jgi:hypothetical protein
MKPVFPKVNSRIRGHWYRSPEYLSKTYNLFPRSVWNRAEVLRSFLRRFFNLEFDLE